VASWAPRSSWRAQRSAISRSSRRSAVKVVVPAAGYVAIACFVAAGWVAESGAKGALTRYAAAWSWLVRGSR
jgi:hypothetical protein